MGALEGKTCIVTGGAGSIGLATARLFLAEGARVMLADLVEGALKAALHGLDPTRIAMVATDVTHGDSVGRCVEATVLR
jgi:NAD(P)-dependent dehydrogenase (short-subunit alcohol dehydrogenase family)